MNREIVQIKPKMGFSKDKPFRFYIRSVNANSPMGLLLTITYSADEEFTTNYNPILGD